MQTTTNTAGPPSSARTPGPTPARDRTSSSPPSRSSRRSLASRAPALARRPDQRSTQRLAQGLAWASVGLGLAELLAPGRMVRMVGVRDQRSARRLMMLMGLRKLVVGAGLLAGQRRAPWLWMRVGGDLVDLALLRAWRGARRNDAQRITGVMTAVAGITMLDAFAARRSASLGLEPITTTAVVTIARPPEEVYRFWRDFRNLPRFMVHLAAVEVIDEQRSHWKVIGPGRAAVEWDAEIVEDQPGEAIAWRSLPGADVDNSGIVRFVPAPGGRGTEIHVELRYAAPGGRVGQAIATLLGREPGQQARGDLRRLKQVLETGGVVCSDASIHPGPHAARPPSPRELASIELPGMPRPQQQKEAAQ